MDNADVVRVLDEIADLLEVTGGNPFRVRAYRGAARTVESLAEPVMKIVERDPMGLCEYPGIGEDLCNKITEIARTGDVEVRRELEKKVPASIVTMMRVEGIGPKRAKLFYDQLGLRSLDDLEAAARGGKLHGIRGIGEALEKRIVRGCEEERQRGARRGLAEADAHAEAIVAWLRASRAAESVEIAGSLRRRRDTIGDIDVLVASRDPQAVAERFCAFEETDKVLAHGETKCSIVLRSGIQVDLRVVEPECFGAALHYFTGSKAHNIAVRLLGVKRKLKISEYGVFRGDERVAGRTEREVFGAVGMPFIAPELRENRGEIEAAKAGALPVLVERAQIRGDLRVHTSPTEGGSLEEMVKACVARGYAYVAFMDHSGAQARAIRALQKRTPGIRILRGAEVDILEDGTLGLDAATLANLDVVVAAVHTKLDMPEAAMTRRILRALDDPRVMVLAHPTGRLIGRREPSAFDAAKVFAAARDRGVLLEIDARPDRLDLSDVLVRMARDLGARFVIDTGARRVSELDCMRYGVDQARRGWCAARDVVNTLPLDAMLRSLRARQRGTIAAHA